MSKKTRIIGALAVSILIPLTCFIVISQLSKDKLHLPPYYVVDHVVTSPEGTNDTIYHQVAEARFINQFGDTVSLNKDLKGKILVVDFIFTTCPTVCPQLTSNMEAIQHSFRKDPKRKSRLDTAIQFISITVDPERDSFPVMRKYADDHNVNRKNWWFLTGSREDVYNYARKELRVQVGEGGEGLDDLLHTQKIVVLDTMRYIRGYYDGLDTADMIRCTDDIVILTKQKYRKKEND